MPENRTPKRSRKKEAAAIKRAQRLAMLKKRRQRRVAILAAITAIMATTGIGVILATQKDETPIASPSPAPKQEERLVPTENSTIWRLDTTQGVIDIALDTERSPKTTDSIIKLTRDGFYDGLTFHRIVPGFVIQGGDPKGDGTGGPDTKVTEPPPKGLKFGRGVVAMAKAGNEPDGTSGSQFFITTHDGQQPLDPYAYVGEVTVGFEAVDAIAALGSGSDGPPTQEVKINTATVIEK